MPTRAECANAIRAISIDAIEKAKSGHPGAPMGMADIAESLWRGFLKHNPANPSWVNRDRFVLSNGHASAMLYSLLYLTGYELTMDDIKNFRQLGSLTPGHPEVGKTPGVEVTTGPLGQGIGSAVGMALAEKITAARFNREGFPIIDHHTWVFLGDGCLMEGITQEACSLAGTWKLGKLIVFYDDNNISIDGNVKGWFTENTPARFEALGWQVLPGVDGHDPEAIDMAIKTAMAATDKPSLICCKTVIGKFAPTKAGTAKCHGSPLGAEEAEAAKKAMNWNNPPFTVPEDILSDWNARKQGEKDQGEWDSLFQKYATQYPDLAKEFTRCFNGSLPENWNSTVQTLLESALKETKPLATRAEGKNVLDVIAPILPELIGGSADLSGSVGTEFKGAVTLTSDNYVANYIRYGVREFGMSAIMNGMCLHGGIIPYAGTFFTFSDYAKNAVRLAALMKRRVIWVLTHDSIGVGEDGPTHQPIEQIAALRLTPNVEVWRPADSTETAVAWTSAIEKKDGPVCLVMSRQSLPQLPHDLAQVADIRRGAYICRDCDGIPEGIIIATGSEVQLAMEAAETLNKQSHKIRVVSMPSCEVFDRQPKEYRDKILPPSVRKRIAVEAQCRDYWYKYVGLDGAIIGMDSFGASAPASKLYEYFQITVDNILFTTLKVIKGEIL